MIAKCQTCHAPYICSDYIPYYWAIQYSGGLIFNIKSIEKRRADTMPRMDLMEQWLIQDEKKPDQSTTIDFTAPVTMTLGTAGGTIGSVLDAFFYSKPPL